jgi:hypothetical protein
MNYLKRRLERRDHLIMEEEEYAEQYEGNVYTSTVINNLFFYLFFSSFFSFLLQPVSYPPAPKMTSIVSTLFLSVMGGGFRY